MTTNGSPAEPENVTRYFLIRGKRFDMPEEMTGREFRYIKQETDLRAGEITDAVNGGDADVILCLAAIAMRRAGEAVEVEDLMDLRIGKPDEFEVMEDVDDGRPTVDVEAEAVVAVAPKKASAAGKRGRRPSSESTD
jgi:hypothetical protein